MEFDEKIWVGSCMSSGERMYGQKSITVGQNQNCRSTLDPKALALIYYN